MGASELSLFLKELVDKRKIAGNSFALMKDGKTVFEQYYGLADRETGRKINKDTLFRMFSMTKIFTMVCLMRLYEEGKFRLDDKLKNYLPEFSDMKVCIRDESGKVSFRPAKSDILIKDVMSMTSGMVYSDDDNTAAPFLKQAIERLKEKDVNYGTRDYAKAVASSPLEFDPGTHWHYSTSHEIAGALIEVLSGERLGEYIDNNVCRPLGLKDTFFRAPDEVLSNRLAVYYDTRPDGSYTALTEADERYRPGRKMERGGGGLISSLYDYLRFADALTNGGTSRDGVRIIGKDALSLICSDCLNEEQKKDFDLPSRLGYSYGLGVRIMLDPEKAGSGGKGEFGWSGAAGTFVLMDPEKQLTAVYLEQAKPTHAPYIFPRVRKMIYEMI